MRVGIIGRGWGERVVAPAFAATEGCQVVEVVTPRDETAVAALCGRADVDLISVHSPPFLHLEHVRRAAEAGHAVLCDKPFGRNGEDASVMCALAHEAGVLAFLNFEQRYDEGRKRLRQIVADGAIGQPEHVHWTMLLATTRAPMRPFGWLFDDSRGGGWLRAAGSHLIDFVRWNFGEVTEAYGQIRTAVLERPDANRKLHRCTADDGFVANLQTQRGVTVVIDSSSAAAVPLTPWISVVGSAGVLEVIGERIVLHDGDGPREVFTPDTGVNSIAASQQAYAAVIRDALREGSLPPDTPTFADGLACVEVMDRLLAGGRAGEQRAQNPRQP
jgi:predicted dehydrogenase